MTKNILQYTTPTAGNSSAVPISRKKGGRALESLLDGGHVRGSQKVVTLPGLPTEKASGLARLIFSNQSLSRWIVSVKALIGEWGGITIVLTPPDKPSYGYVFNLGELCCPIRQREGYKYSLLLTDLVKRFFSKCLFLLLNKS